MNPEDAAKRMDKRLRAAGFSDDQAVSEVIGTILLIAVTVLLMGGLATLVLNIDPPQDQVHSDLSVFASRGADATWGTNDEIITIQHVGGEAVATNGLSIEISVDETRYAIAGSGLDQGFSDGVFTIGEIWRFETQIQESSKVTVNMVSTQDSSSSQLFFSQVVGIGATCTVDSFPPFAEEWVQNPADVSATTIGSVNVRVKASDVCSPVDQDVDPALEYRLNDGTNPPFISIPMSYVTNSTWNADIPDLTWTNNGGRTLEYRIRGIADTLGNNGLTPTQSDIVQLVGIDTFSDDFLEHKGTLDDYGKMQNENDGGGFARLTEKPGQLPQPYYSNNGDGHGVGDKNNLEGEPNDLRFTLEEGNDDALSKRQDITGGVGSITIVEALFEAQTEGVRVDDTLDFLVKVPGGNWISVANNIVPTTGTDSLIRVDITALDMSGGWTWAEIEDTELQVWYDQYSIDDPVVFHVDAIWIEVRTDGGGPSSEVDILFPTLPPGVSHTLQMKYRSSGNSFDLEALQGGTTWAKKCTGLNQPGWVVWTCTLSATEATADAGSPRLRFVSTGAPTSPPAHINIDYLKVVTS